MSAPLTKCLEWRPLEKNTLRGFAKVEFPSGIQIAENTLHQKNGRYWASPPGRPMVNRDGTVIRDDTGRIQYQTLITFASRQSRDLWSETVLGAVRRDFPDALPPEPDHAAAINADLQKRPWPR